MLLTPENPFPEHTIENFQTVDHIAALRRYIGFIGTIHIGTPEGRTEWNLHRRTADAFGADLLSRQHGALTLDLACGADSLEIGDFESETTPHNLSAYYQALQRGRSQLEDAVPKLGHRLEFAPPQRASSVLRLAGYAIRRYVYHAL